MTSCLDAHRAGWRRDRKDEPRTAPSARLRRTSRHSGGGVRCDRLPAHTDRSQRRTARRRCRRVDACRPARKPAVDRVLGRVSEAAGGVRTSERRRPMPGLLPQRRATGQSRRRDDAGPMAELLGRDQPVGIPVGARSADAVARAGYRRYQPIRHHSRIPQRRWCGCRAGDGRCGDNRTFAGAARCCSRKCWSSSYRLR